MMTKAELEKQVRDLTSNNKFEQAFKMLSEYAEGIGHNTVVNEIKNLERQYNAAKRDTNLGQIDDKKAATEYARIHKAILETILPEIRSSNTPTEKPEVPTETPLHFETEKTSVLDEIISEIQKIKWNKIKLPFSSKSMFLFFCLSATLFFALKYGKPFFMPNETDIKSNIYKGQLAYKNKEYDKAFSILDKYKNDSLFDGESQYMLAKLFFNLGSNPKDTIEALKWLLKSAKNNNSRGLNALGSFYERGIGIDSNTYLALKYYEKAALKGHGLAYLNMGKLYLSSKLGKPDTIKGLDCLKKAANLGEENAYYQLGEFYYEGEGGKINYSEAYKYYELGAKNNDIISMGSLAYMNYYGQGTKEDNNKALFWAKKAADLETYGFAHNLLGNIYYKGHGTDRDYDSAFYWYSKAIRNGNQENFYRVGYMFDVGQGTEIDYDSAAYYYSLAIEKDSSADAMYNLGIIYKRRGNSKLAFELFKKVTKKGYDHALLDIGDLYLDGKNFDKKPSEALKYYQMALNKNYTPAMNSIAAMYYNSKDTLKAFEWYNKAAQKNNALGLCWIGYMFLKGQGVKKDSTKARYYLEKAEVEAAGSTNADKILKEMKN